MSNKDLIERLEGANARSRPPAPRPAPAPGAEPKQQGETTRVATGVVRRRVAEPPPPPTPVPAARTVIRRPGGGRPEDARPNAPQPPAGAVGNSAAPGSLSSGAGQAQSALSSSSPGSGALRRPLAPGALGSVTAPTGAAAQSAGSSEPEAAFVAPVSLPGLPGATTVTAQPPAPEAPSPPEAAVGADEVESERGAQRPPEAAAEASQVQPGEGGATALPSESPAPAPVSDPDVGTGAPAPAAAAETAPAAAAISPSAAAVALPTAGPAAPANPGGRAGVGPRAGAVGLNQRPILPGLGLGVVSLPAGYDPTDPTGARRRAREQAGTQPRWGGGPGGGASLRPGARPAPGGEPAPAAPGEDRFKKGARRGGRSEHTGMQLPEARFRKGKHRSAPEPRQESKVKRRVSVDGEITVAAFARELGVKAAELIKVLMGLGQVATVNQAIDYDTAAIVAQELGHEVVNTAFQESAHLIQHAADDSSELEHRPPVVTVMGHVDHGKTTLLDTIRKAKVAVGEAGGITQHIGAYQVRRGDKHVTFIDTPGHAAFSAMRARGARVTDVIILVVAADDGVMPQTVEAINHAKAAKVPIIVAINKIDKPGIKTDRIKTELMEHGLVSEEYGGDVIFCPVSALKGTGIDALLDSVLLVAEVADLKANPNRPAEGVVIESRIETGRGAVASLLVKTGTLKQGDTLVIGATWGRVRAMSDERGARVKEAPPSTPVEIFGLEDVPNAGDEFVVVGSEKDARTLADHRAQAARAQAVGQRQRLTVDDLFKQGGAASSEVLHVVLKADVGGSLEALKAALEGIEVAGTRLKLLHAAIGPVNESDVNLAAANGALIIAFNAKSDAKARHAADQHNVEIKRFDIIYQAIDEVKARLTGMLAPVYEEQKVGEAEVRAVFNISKSGPIAGCMVVSGKVQRGATGKVTREGKVVHEGKLTGLKRFKEDVREVVEGFECGIQLEAYSDIAVGDRIELTVRVEVPRT